MASFYVVWNEGPCAPNPTVKHKSYQGAKLEAERLARTHALDEFFVMLAVSRSRKVEVVTDELANIDHEDIDCGIPF